MEEEKPEAGDTSNAPGLETKLVTKEAKNASHHSDTSEISGDEGKYCTEQRELSKDPKHDIPPKKNSATALESVEISIDNEISNVTDENIEHDNQQQETVVSTAESQMVQSSQTNGDNLKNDTQANGNCDANMKSVQISTETDEHPESKSQTCNVATVAVKVPEEKCKNPKVDQQQTSQDKILKFRFR